MPFKSKYDLGVFAHCKIPKIQFDILYNRYGKEWSEWVRDLIAKALEDEKP